MFGSFIYDSQDDEMKWTIICICSDNLDNLNLTTSALTKKCQWSWHKGITTNKLSFGLNL
jgi:hypothetical protein